MTEKIKPLLAIKKFVEKDSRPTTMIELKNFWASCAENQKREYAKVAADQLGLELDYSQNEAI